MAWARADFDQDGQPDLLLNAGYGDVYCLLNQGRRPPLVVPVADGRRTVRDCFSFRLIQVAGRAAIAHLHIYGRSSRYEATTRQDTLVYRLGAFVEYNPHPATRPGRRLAFGHSRAAPPSWGYCLTINLKTGWMRVNARRDVAEENQDALSTFRYRLPAAALDTLRQQVAYVPVAKLASKYDVNALDASIYQLTFYRPLRLPWSVTDEGGIGPYALQQLYERLGDLYEQAIAQRRQQPAIHRRPSPSR